MGDSDGCIDMVVRRVVAVLMEDVEHPQTHIEDHHRLNSVDG